MEDTVINRNFVLGTALLLPLISAVPAHAQRVNADIIIGGGPVAGRVIIGDRGRDGYRGRPRPIRRVEWIRSRDYRRDDWWRRFQRESRIVVVFWDRDDDSYYLDRFRSGLLEIRLFERDGRFYRLEDERYGRRYDDRYDRRYDDRDRRYDDRDGYGDRRRDDRRDNRRDGWDGRDNRRDDHRDDRRDRPGN
ncbi:MAG TPA: hypothetical protein VFU23_07500 [Gemmatimonadales bacterium]|nr:hypothetical protein [Gemmatimonadales bacterium]